MSGLGGCASNELGMSMDEWNQFTVVITVTATFWWVTWMYTLQV